MTSKPTRLNFAALIFFLIDAVKGAIFPFIVAIMGVNNAKSQLWTIGTIVIFLVLVIGTTILQYYMFTYQLLPDEIVVKSGIFVKKVNHVPYDRIQNVTTNQWFFLKPFNLEELEIETAGHSDKPEVQLKAVPDSLRQQINDLRNHVKTEEISEEPEKIETETTEIENDGNTYTISWKDLLKFSFTSPAFLTGLLFVLAAYGKVQKAISSQVYRNIAQEVGHLGILIVIAVVLIILLLFYLGSVIILIVQYYHFKLTEKDGRFIMERGLLKTNKTSISMDRIQAVMVKQPWLRSFLNIVTVQLVIISNSKKGDSEKDIIVMPVIAKRDVNQFLKRFFPDIPVDEFKQFQPNKWTYYYKLRNALIFTVITAILILLLTHTIIWLSITLVILGIICWILPAYQSIKRSKAEVLTRDYIAIQNNHVMTKQLFFVPRDRIQFIEKRDSIWLEKRDCASLIVNIRSGVNQKHIRSSYQAVQDVDAVLKWYKK